MTKHKTVLLLAFGASLLHALIALGTVWGDFFFGHVGRGHMYDDVDIYFRYGSLAMQGSVPYRDFLVEYPLLSFPLFFLPRVIAWDIATYRVAFGLEMLSINALAVVGLARRVARVEGPERVAGRLAWYTVFFATQSPLAMTRFDLAPMALAFASATFWSSGAAIRGGMLAGLGTLVKIMPGAVIVPSVLGKSGRADRARLRGLAAFLATVSAGVGLWAYLGGEGVVASLRYHSERGLEAGSLPAGILLAAGKCGGLKMSLEDRHSSAELEMPGAASVARWILPLPILALLFVAWLSWRSRLDDDPMRLATASVLAFFLFGKVLSPQYLIWLFPFIASLRGGRGERARRLFLIACLLTTVLYPWMAGSLEAMNWSAILVLNARNLLLLALWAELCFPEPNGSGRAKK